LLDFTDMIETCYREVYAAPKNPSVIFADEAQDLNRMQLSLVRKWGERASYFIMAGDDDQTVFSFCGATPEAFLDPDVPDDHKIILKQSYRVPRAVHTTAEALIRQVTRRQAKEYLSRPENGELHRLSRGGYKSAEYGILKTATEHLERGRTVMFLASCSYMLRPLVAMLRKQGIPFHNPYRKGNGFWNPIRIGKPSATGSRILALISGHPDYGEDHRPWTHADLAAWAELLQVKGILRHGVKAKLKTYDPAQRVSFERLDEIFEPDTLESLMRAWDCGYRDLLEWWRTRVTADVSERVKFPSDITATRGPRALLETPKVVVGTIHSVKGGQADVVYLCPDISQAGDAQYVRGGPARDSVIRLFYVGLTRARETLYICQRETGMAVTI
jgi:DNA helicase II / ATP-dependent DNA helicase PcrA